MLEKANKIRVLFKKYAMGELTTIERQELEEYLRQSPDNEALLRELNSEEGIDSLFRQYVAAENIWTASDSPFRVPVRTITPTPSRRKYYYAAAAVVAITTAAVFYFATSRTSSPHPNNVATRSQQSDRLPGSRRAVLTLANQSTIQLDDAKAGVIASEGNTTIQKNADGSILYQGSGSNMNTGLHTLTIPRGGDYTITLSDGSRVWLNAATTMRYPPSFKGLSERRIYLTAGEAYFEIVKNNAQPFYVETGKGTSIRVTGTRFNVNTYEDESVEQTSLLEGSVVISAAHKEHKLVPGQQATYVPATNRLTVGEANVQSAVYWVKGYFSFQRANLKEIMRQIARWYDVQVEYAPGVGDQLQVQGSFSRNIPLSEVLNILRRYDDSIEYTLENTKVLVHRKNP